jgi:hypothetical protein
MFFTFHLFYWQIMCRFCMAAVGCWLSDKAEVVKSAGLALRYTHSLPHTVFHNSSYDCSTLDFAAEASRKSYDFSIFLIK